MYTRKKRVDAAVTTDTLDPEKNRCKGCVTSVIKKYRWEFVPGVFQVFALLQLAYDDNTTLWPIIAL